MIRFNPAANAVDTRTPEWPTELARLAERSSQPGLQAYYRAGCPAGDTPLEEVPLAALDIETTGLDARRDAIISIGLMPFNLQRIRCREAFYEVVKPDIPLSEESITYHRITHSDIRQASDPASTLNRLLEAMAGRIMVVHYRALERAFLDRAARQYLGEPLFSRLLIPCSSKPECTAAAPSPDGWPACSDARSNPSAWRTAASATVCRTTTPTTR